MAEKITAVAHSQCATAQPANKRAKHVALENTAVKVSYKPPYNYDELLSFFQSRLLKGVEKVEDGAYLRTVRYAEGEGAEVHGWVRVTNDAARNALVVELSESLLPYISDVIARIRRQFDTDCEPSAIEAGLATLQDARPAARAAGTRLPGCFETFETMCRAVIGQQITVTAANRIAARVTEAYGTPLDTGIEGLDRSFPTPAELIALDDIEAALGTLGVIKTRSRVIATLAQYMIDGNLGPNSEVPVEQQMSDLLAIKGIGPWTMNYIAMRTLAYPDAFLESDSGIAHALPDLTPKERLALAEAWHPWRSYANIALWNSLASPSSNEQESK